MPKGLYTADELKEAGRTVIMVTVKKGSTGDAVMQLQEWLNELGYNCGTPDGKLGGNTDAAVRKFQNDHGLKADGVVGTLTWNAIDEALGSSDTGDKDGGEDKQDSADVPGMDADTLDRVRLLAAELEREMTVVNDMIQELKAQIAAMGAVG